MTKGYLSQYFQAVAAKRITDVEVNPKSSNQHEFNGTKALKRVLGTNEDGERLYFPARFLWIGEENETVGSDGTLTWYDSRFQDPERSPEFRLYFPDTDVTTMTRAGDLLFIAKRPEGSILCIVVEKGSTVENQLLWLFDVPVQVRNTFIYQNFESNAGREVDFAARFILDELGIEIEDPETYHLDKVLEKFGAHFPPTREFSFFARQSLPSQDVIHNPDAALVAWMNLEDKLFRRLERFIIDQRLKNGFIESGVSDVDGFISFSLSVQGRRKSRAGWALENHLEEIFKLNNIKFDRSVITENNFKPDYLFPGILEYKNLMFPDANLTMLAAKTSLKDRWSQILNEAERISKKHLLTLDPGLSENQTNAMRAKNIQLVLPSFFHSSYKPEQQKWLMNLKDFIVMVKDKQSA